MQFLYQPGPGSAGATFPPASIHGYSPTVGLFTSPPSRAGWPSVSEVGVGVRVPKPGFSWEVWSLPPSVLGASAESFLPLKWKEEDSEIGAHFSSERITQFESPMGPS